MLNKKLKKVNYIRFLQLLIVNNKNKEFLEVIFLLENELLRIFNATEDQNLKLIKYQWYLDETKKKSSEHFLVDEIIILKTKFELQSLFENLIAEYQKLSIQMNHYDKIFFIFERISRLYNQIIKLIIPDSHQLYQTSPLFQFCYFLYHSETQKYPYENIKNLITEYDDTKINYFEKIFCKCFLKSYKNNKRKKISKIEYIFYIFVGIFIK